jgi:hypothetical protein
MSSQNAPKSQAEVYVNGREVNPPRSAMTGAKLQKIYNDFWADPENHVLNKAVLYLEQVKIAADLRQFKREVLASRAKGNRRSVESNRDKKAKRDPLIQRLAAGGMEAHLIGKHPDVMSLNGGKSLSAIRIRAIRRQSKK